MLNKMFTRQPRLEHPEPAQRLLGLAELPPDSEDLARLMLTDPAPSVRAAAARQCTSLDALVQALAGETEPEVRDAIASALVGALAESPDGDRAHELLKADGLTDALRSNVARRAPAIARRRLAIEAIREEEPLIDLVLGAEHADTRMAAAERVQSHAGLQKLYDLAKNKDHGVARLARQRLDVIKNRLTQGAEADAILSQLEALAAEPGPILTAVVELNRRWQGLDISGDAARLARCEVARQTIQARFDREQEEQRAKSQYERRLREWIAALEILAPTATEALTDARASLEALRDEARSRGDGTALARLDVAEQRIVKWEQERAALAGAEALVIEAERLAADTSIDNAELPARWQALNRATRTPELTRRFEAALMTVEQRRLAQVQATQQLLSAVKLELHSALHAAEQALAAGQLQAARTAAEAIRALKAGAGQLPKPTTQRLSRVVQQLTDLERWESFGQHNARLQLCERAEALAAQTTDPAQLAQDVQKLRNDWKALDQQHAGVPKALWERFDRACEKAYAPAARHFAELAAQRKEARKRREEFIAAAALHAPTLVTETPDWRAIERWLRETDQAWREGSMGSVDPGAWKKLDVRLKEAVAPARDALSAARDKAKTGREALIAEAQALGAKAMERETPSQVKAIQLRWQEQAKLLSLSPRDERVLWEQFRAACDAVFNARQSRRKEEDGKKTEHRRALDELCAQVEQLAQATDKSDQDLKRTLREAQERWKTLAGGFDPALREVETRFKKAKAAVDTLLSTRTRSREAAVWQTLSAKERLCEELDSAVQAGAGSNAVEAAAASVQEQWAKLPEMSAPWEKRMAARRDAAMRALSDAGIAGKHVAAIERNALLRREILVELELVLGLDTPPSFQAQRLALQVKQLKERFSSAVTASAESAGERLLAWCALSGVADALDRQRSERIFAKVGDARNRS
jgi:DNA repair protein SbcC/Rad50